MIVKFMPLRDVLAATGLPRSTLYEKIAANEFPAPVQISPRRVAWPEDEVADWQRTKIEARAAPYRKGGA